MEKFKLGLILFSLILVSDAVALADDQVVDLKSASCSSQNYKNVSVNLSNSLYYYVVTQANKTCQGRLSDPGLSTLNSAKVHYVVSETGSVSSIVINVAGVCMSKKNLVEGDVFKAAYVLKAGSDIVSDISAQIGLQGNKYCSSALPGSYGSFQVSAGGASSNVLKQVTGTVSCQVCDSVASFIPPKLR